MVAEGGCSELAERRKSTKQNNKREDTKGISKREKFLSIFQLTHETKTRKERRENFTNEKRYLSLSLSQHQKKEFQHLSKQREKFHSATKEHIFEQRTIINNERSRRSDEL